MEVATLISAIRTKRPRELFDRGLTFLENAIDGGHEGATYMLCSEEEIFAGTGISTSLLDDGPVFEIGVQIKNQQRSAPLPLSGVAHDAGCLLAKFCYAYCRSKRPKIVVETGVGNGVTTSFILQALDANSEGHLISIDLPPLGLSSGQFVPTSLKKRWTLISGRSRRVLPSLLAEFPEGIDLFLHDSLHTYRNMMFEYTSAWAALKPAGAIISDDIAFNRAFQNFAERNNHDFAGVHSHALYGVATKPA